VSALPVPINPSTLRSRNYRERIRLAKQAALPQSRYLPISFSHSSATTPLANPQESNNQVQVGISPSMLRSRKWREQKRLAAQQNLNPAYQVQTLQTSESESRVQAPILSTPNMIPGWPQAKIVDSTQTTLTESEQHASGITHWPRRLGKVGGPSATRFAVLNQGIHDIKRGINRRSKSSTIRGHLLMKYIQVLNFLKVQALQERRWSMKQEYILIKTREQLAKQVADGEGAGQWTWRQLMKNAVSWIKERMIQHPKKGRHPKITSMLKDEGTLLAVREYISQAGEGKKFLIMKCVVNYRTNKSIAVDSFGMAKAISCHLAELNDDVRPPSGGRIVREIQRTISSRSSRRWLCKLGFKWK